MRPAGKIATTRSVGNFICVYYAQQRGSVTFHDKHFQGMLAQHENFWRGSYDQSADWGTKKKETHSLGWLLGLVIWLGFSSL
jgi:hypothetical protein